MHYLFDDLGRYAGTTAQPTARSTPKKPEALSPEYNWNGYDWVHVPSVAGGLVPVAGELPAAPVDITVTPPEFKLLWTAPERIAIAGIRKGDSPELAAAFNDFFEILDDPRLTAVNLSLPSNRVAVATVLTVLHQLGVVEDVEARTAAILSGVVQ